MRRPFDPQQPLIRASLHNKLALELAMMSEILDAPSGVVERVHADLTRDRQPGKGRTGMAPLGGQSVRTATAGAARRSRSGSPAGLLAELLLEVGDEPALDSLGLVRPVHGLPAHHGDAPSRGRGVRSRREGYRPRRRVTLEHILDTAADTAQRSRAVDLDGPARGVLDLEAGGRMRLAPGERGAEIEARRRLLIGGCHGGLVVGHHGGLIDDRRSDGPRVHRGLVDDRRSDGPRVGRDLRFTDRLRLGR